jgi:integrase/recombinase XerD
VAQLVEHNLAKVGVAGSNPVVRSNVLGKRAGGCGLINRAKYEDATMAATQLSLPELTLTGWWPFWLIELQARGVRPATVSNQRKALTKLERSVGDVAPAALTTDVIAGWQAHMRAVECLRPSTINLYAMNVLTFLHWLLAEGELLEAPKVKRLRDAAPGAPDVYKPDALATLTAGAQMEGRGRSRFDQVRDTAIIALLQDSGIRASECAGLEVKNVDLAARQAFVHADIAKAGYSRTVCFGHRTARALSQYMRVRASHEYAWCPQLFLGRRGPATYFLVSSVVSKAGKRAGMDGARTHRFRHTWAHDLKSQGVGDEVLMSLGGWRSHAMVQRYGRAERDTRAAEAYRRVGSPVDRQSMTRRHPG